MIRARPPPGAHATPQPYPDGKGASILGPTNPPRGPQAQDLLPPPRTDHGTLPSLRWSFADSHNRLEEGGWARQTTIRELPIATEIAGVNMRLKAGAVRELHWHKEAEGAYMIAGRARITAVDPELRTFQDDVSEGDLWDFPAGVPHSIQGLADDGCEMLLVAATATSTRTRAFCSRTGWRIRHGRFSPRTSRCPRAPLLTSPTTSSTSSMRRCPARSARSGSPAPGRSPSPSPTTCSPRSRSGRREAASASSTRGRSRHPRRFPRP